MNYPYYNPYGNMYGSRQDMPRTQPSMYACRPVTSQAEAVAAQIPFDGSTTYFIDTSNGNIYAKTFNFADGTAPLDVYVKQVAESIQYATKDELNSLREELEKIKGREIL